MTKKTYIGVGLYSYPEAARIIGVSPERVRRWVDDYYYTSKGRRYHHEPIIHRYSVEPFLTFLELVELLFVRMFRDEGVSMSTIRKAADRASQMFDEDYPFAVKRFDTDGKHIFATLAEDDPSGSLVEDVSRGQYAFDTVVRPFFRKLEYGDNAAALLLRPRGPEDRVVIDPERRFGKPIDEQTGVPTDVLYEAVNAGNGQSYEDVADWYDVPVEAVEAAVAYEESPNVA